MKRLRILILVAGAVSALPALASPLCTTGNLGASSYGAGGFSCQIGVNIFSGFTFGASGTANPLVSNAASITVTPQVLSTGIGFSFSGNFSVAGTGSSSRAYTDTIQYIVNAPTTSLTPWFYNATTKVSGGTVAGSGTYSETKTVYSDAARTIIIDAVPSVTNATAQSQTNGITGAPVITMYIKDQISLKSNSTSALSTASFTSFENLYQTPEPGSMALLATGLLGLGLALRRRKA